jgi:predicted amidophosphoribosyltransferase
LSAPVTDTAGAVVGNLFLKVDDSANIKLYLSRYYAIRSSIYNELLEPLFGTFAVLSGIFLWFLLPSWVYIDAQQRGLSNPGVWAFIALISLVFGLAIYLITRPATMKSLHCPKCENQLNGGAFCPHCGFDLSSTYCSQCQYPIKPEWAYCPNCRAGLTQQKTLEAPAEQAKSLEALSEKE